jgi:hypothetical protein
MKTLFLTLIGVVGLVGVGWGQHFQDLQWNFSHTHNGQVFALPSSSDGSTGWEIYEPNMVAGNSGNFMVAGWSAPYSVDAAFYGVQIRAPKIVDGGVSDKGMYMHIEIHPEGYFAMPYLSAIYKGDALGNWIVASARLRDGSGNDFNVAGELPQQIKLEDVFGDQITADHVSRQFPFPLWEGTLSFGGSGVCILTKSRELNDGLEFQDGEWNVKQ